MSSDRSFVELVAETASGAGEVSFKAMFGEYGFYCDGKLVALVCDNQLLVKPTKAGEAMFDPVEWRPPYPGAKDCLLVSEGIEDPEWLSELFRVTAKELPPPKPKKPRKQSK